MHESIFTTQRGPTAALQPVRTHLTGLHNAGGWEGKTNEDASIASLSQTSAAQEANPARETMHSTECERVDRRRAVRAFASSREHLDVGDRDPKNRNHKTPKTAREKRKK